MTFLARPQCALLGSASPTIKLVRCCGAGVELAGGVGLGDQHSVHERIRLHARQAGAHEAHAIYCSCQAIRSVSDQGCQVPQELCYAGQLHGLRALFTVVVARANSCHVVPALISGRGLIPHGSLQLPCAMTGLVGAAADLHAHTFRIL